MPVMPKAMADRRLLVAALLLVVAAAAITAWLLIKAPGGHYPHERVVYWQLSVENTTAAPLRAVEVRSFAPLRRSWQQRLVALEASVPLVGREDDRPDGEIRARVPVIPPYGRKDLRFRARVAMAADHRNGREADGRVPRPVQSGDASGADAIARHARRLERATPMATTRSIYDWLVSEIEYTGYDPIDRGAAAALEKRAGDCSEYASLAVALAQALKIEARKVNGFVVREDRRLGPFDFHAWAEVRVDGRWVIVDAQERRFDPAPSSYLATGYGPEGRDKGQIKFAAASEAVRIQMQ